MSKAEDLALGKYPPRSVLVVPARGGGYYADSHLREGFIEGYHQAEKDLALTWRDIADIDNIITEILKECDNKILYDTEKGFCQEVLNRFKKLKEK